MNKTYHIFLASSNELEEERKSFENFINRENKRLKDQYVFLYLENWEDMDDAFNETYKQADYNKFLEKSHICVVLFWTKVGKYLEEEFDLAYDLFKEQGLPRLYVYEKTSLPAALKENWEESSKGEFLKKIDRAGNVQFQSKFATYHEFESRFKRSLEDLFHHNFFTPGEPAKVLYTDGQAMVPEIFKGRDSDLQAIRSRLNNKNRRIILSGEGGMGKTTLAAKFADEYADFYEYKAWIFCKSDILNDLKPLIKDLAYFNDCITDDQILYKLRLGLLELPENTLLILDNLNDPASFQFFREKFGDLKWHILITSRYNTSIENQHVLKPLPEKLAEELFREWYNEETPDFEYNLSHILKAIGYNTLLIEILSKNLSKAKAIIRETLTSYIKKLEDNGLLLEHGSFTIDSHYLSNIHQTKIGQIANTDQILEVLYNFVNLNNIERYWLANISLLPAQSYEAYFLEKLWGNPSKSICDTYLEELARKGWIISENYSYRISPVVQKLVLAKEKENLGGYATELLGNLETILQNDGANFTNIKLNDAAAYARLAATISKHLRDYPSYKLGLLNFNAGLYFERTGDTSQAFQFYKNYGKVGEKIEHTAAIAVAYSKMGSIYEATGDWKNAQANYREFNRLQKETHESTPDNLGYKNVLAISYERMGKIYEATGDWKKALTNYQEYNRLQKETHESTPENLEYKNVLAISYSKLGGIYEATGDWKKALTNYQEYNRLQKETHESTPENLEYKNVLAISYSKLGGIYEATGDWKKALTNYQEYNRLQKETHESTPENLGYKNVLAISYSKLGEIYQATGDWKKALTNYQEYNRLQKETHESTPENLEYKNVLAISYSKLGEIYQATGDWKKALTNYQEYNRLQKETHESTPDNLGYKNVLAISYERMGKIYEATGDWKKALTNYQEYNRLQKETHESTPENLGYKNGLAISYSKLGGIYEATGDWKKALTNYQEYNRLQKETHESTPDNLEYKNVLAISYERMGKIYEATGDWKKALTTYQEYNRLQKETHESTPENLEYKNVLAISYSKLGGIYEATGDWKKALTNYQEYNRLQKETHESTPDNLEYKNVLAISYERMGKIYEATGDWKKALTTYQEYNRLQKETHESTPENLGYKNGLAISYSKLGGIYEATGDWKKALANYQEDFKITKQIYESSLESLSYKNSLAISYLKLGFLFLKQDDRDVAGALSNILQSRTLFAELCKDTQGNIIDFAYNFAYSTMYVSDLEKENIKDHVYAKGDTVEISTKIKAMRREASTILQNLAEQEKLTESQLKLMIILEDETWYHF